MGLLKLLRNANNAEGAREAIRMSYLKHYRMAEQQGIEPHSTGLYGALASRRKAAGQFKGEPVLWAELAPFLSMPPELGREALAEYIICIERPAEGRIGWLRDQVNQFLAAPYDSEQAAEARRLAAMSLASVAPMLPWAQWLREEVGKALLLTAEELAEAPDE